MTSALPVATTARRARALPRRLGTLLVTLVAATGLLVGAPSAAWAGPNEGDFFSAVNAARAAQGIAPLSYASDLTEVARRQAARMASSGELFHNPNLGSEVSGWQIVSENVGYGGDWRSIQDAFMGSSGHRANLLDPELTQLGVGTVVDRDGLMWVAQVFRRPFGATSDSSTASPSATSGSSVSAATSGGSATFAPPSAQEQLRDRLEQARDQAARRSGRPSDPLSDALAFAAVMSTVAG